MKNSLYILFIVLGFTSCEKATVVQNVNSFCADGYANKFNVTGKIFFDSLEFPYNRFDAMITDSTSSVYLIYREENKTETPLSILNLPLNDTLFSRPDTNLTFLGAGGFSQCDVIIPCFWNDGPENSNWALLSTVDSVRYTLEVNSMLYSSYYSIDNCELYQSLTDTIKTEINIEFEAL
jgi:hypothetical protein